MDTLGIRKGLLLIEVYVKWRIQGRGPGGPAPPPLFLDQTEARRAEKFFGGHRAPLISGSG